MICIRCGHCCRFFIAAIVDDPEKVKPGKDNIFEDNVIVRTGEKREPCKHLRGDGPGGYDCVIHDKWWYDQTPCFLYAQVKKNDNEPCRVGVYILANGMERP
jgi:hypothetical protein